MGTRARVLWEEGVKIAVPLVGDVPIRLLEEAARASRSPADLVEWRVDFLRAEAVQDVLKVGRSVREILDEKPLLVTLRSPREGGASNLPASLRPDVLTELLLSGVPDLLDIELEGEPSLVEAPDRLARERDVPRVGSRHILDGTPSVPWMTDVLVDAHRRGYVPKLAVTPRHMEDVARLLEATALARARGVDGPLITMAMGEIGTVSRVVGAAFGSTVTFASVGRPSAPGQMPLEDLVRALGVLESLGLFDEKDGAPPVGHR